MPPVKRMTIIAALCAIAACAVVKPPPGGPEDTTPPFITGLDPGIDSAGVARDTEIVISFSEKVDGDSFKDRIRIYPPLEFEKIKVKGATISIGFRQSLPETTFCFVLRGGYRDRHQVENKQDFMYYFATAPALAHGEISGAILFKNKLDSTAVAKIFSVAADSSFDFAADRESRIAFAGPDGKFVFRALPTDSAQFVLWAFSDVDGNATFTAGKDFSAVYPDTIVLTEAAHWYEDIVLNIVDPNEPGTVEGTVINETGLPGPPTIRLDPLMPGEKPIVALADSTGGFIVPKIPPGSYIVSSFIDVRVDSLCGDYPAAEDSTIMRMEPCFVADDTLVVEPGAKRTLDPLRLEKERESS
jgi:hypothetical protein